MSRSQYAAAEVDEARLIIRIAANHLSQVERESLQAIVDDVPLIRVAERLGITKGGVWQAQRRAIEKMRKRLGTIGIRSTAQLLSL